MPAHPPETWYNIDCIINRTDPAYSGPYPAYFEQQAYPWCAKTAASYPEMLSEYNAYRERHTVRPYFYEEQSGYTGKWKTVPLLTWGIRRKNAKHFPRTMAVLQQIPGLVSVSFSLLDAGGEIQAHQGDSDAYIRGHLCLKQAEDARQLGFHVNQIPRNWQTGQWLLFCDAYWHGGWNHSPEERVVIIADIIHPEHLGHQHQVCARILSGLALNYLLVKSNIRNPGSIPRSILRFAQQCIQTGFRILIALRLIL